jgi:hypothetical protein
MLASEGHSSHGAKIVAPMERRCRHFQSRGATASNPTHFTDVQQFPTAVHWAMMTYPMYTCDLTLNPTFHNKMLHGVTMRWREGIPNARVHGGMDAFWSFPELCFSSFCEEEYGQPSFGLSHTWRDMCLTQPPITTGILEVQSRVECQAVRVSVRDHSGITLGLLHDTIAASLGQEFHKNLAPGNSDCFWGDFRFVSNRENLTEQYH